MRPAHRGQERQMVLLIKAVSGNLVGTALPASCGKRARQAGEIPLRRPDHLRRPRYAMRRDHRFECRDLLLWLASSPRRRRAMHVRPLRACASLTSNGPPGHTSISRCSSCARSRIASRNLMKPADHRHPLADNAVPRPRRPDIRYPTRHHQPLRRSPRGSSDRRNCRDR